MSRYPSIRASRFFLLALVVLQGLLIADGCGSGGQHEKSRANTKLQIQEQEELIKTTQENNVKLQKAVEYQKEIKRLKDEIEIKRAEASKVEAEFKQTADKVLR